MRKEYQEVATVGDVGVFVGELPVGLLGTETNQVILRISA